MNDKRNRFEAQVLPHLDAAYRFARWLSPGPGDADDLVQDAVLRAFRGFESLRGSNAKAWLLAIVKNCHWTALQQRRQRGFVPLPDEAQGMDAAALVANDADPLEQSVQRDEERTFARLLAALPAEHREILLLREIEELAYQEIATVIGIPIGTVMSRLARARAGLKTQWQRHTEDRVHDVR